MRSNLAQKISSIVGFCLPLLKPGENLCEIVKHGVCNITIRIRTLEKKARLVVIALGVRKIAKCEDLTF